MIPAAEPILPPPPKEYNQLAFASWASQLAQFFRRLNNGGQVTASTLCLTNLPTSAAGLKSGQVWRDSAAGDVIKIVP